MGKNFLIIKQIELNFFIKLSICDFQLRWQSKCMPKNMMFSETVTARLLYALCNGYVRSLKEANIMCFEYQMVILKPFKNIVYY